MTIDVRTIVLSALADIAPEVDPETIDGSVPLQQQLDLDSLNFLDLLVAVGDQTGIEVPESDYDQVATLDGCVAYVEGRLAGSSA